MTQSEVAALGAWWWGLGVGKELECIIEGLITACQEGPGVSQWTPPVGGEGSVRCYVKKD